MYGSDVFKLGYRPLYTKAQDEVVCIEMVLNCTLPHKASLIGTTYDKSPGIIDVSDLLLIQACNKYVEWRRLGLNKVCILIGLDIGSEVRPVIRSKI